MNMLTIEHFIDIVTNRELHSNGNTIILFDANSYDDVIVDVKDNVLEYNGKSYEFDKNEIDYLLESI